MDRRRFLWTSASALALTGSSSMRLAFAQDNQTQAAAAFSFDDLTDRMRQKAQAPYEAVESPLPKSIQDFSVAEYRAIQYRPNRALWRGGDGLYEVQAFHPGWLFKLPVRMFEVVDGRANPVVFTAADFEYRAPLDPARFAGFELPGIAGFRLHYPLNRPDYRDELVSFLGNSNFRALGRNSIYGLSARGLCLNTASDSQEEFPAFTEFYLERPEAGRGVMRIWAALEGPSVTGAYAFEIRPGANTIVDVTARLFFREAVERLGVAPLSSMFLFGENENRGFDDYRPEVHDSDGLIIVNGDGEEIFRPLRNPSSLRVSFFSVSNPSRFGLSQRDRTFDHYQDLNARFSRRPSVWIQPRNDWGPGRIFLAEVPTDSEGNDNIVAFWQPETEPVAGDTREFNYRMIWGDVAEPRDDLARVVDTFSGRSGRSGANADPNMRRFVVDFAGGMLANLARETRPMATVESGSGRIADMTLTPLPGKGRWRLVIDVQRSSENPVELRAFLRFNDQRLSETWLYQWSS